MSKFQSDGGSSDYYKLKIVNRKTGEVFYCEMGDVIASVYNNDFDMGNIAKAMRRITEDRAGRGKAGADSKYDAKKCEYFSGILSQVANLIVKEPLTVQFGQPEIRVADPEPLYTLTANGVQRV